METKITFIGAGNLASQLSTNLQKKGFKISQVYNRTKPVAKDLAEKLGSKYTSDVKKIDRDVDIFIVALKDSAFEEVLSQINFNNKLVVHCSGSLPVSCLYPYSENTGVLYPLQTLSKQREVDFNNIPVFVEANSIKNENILLKVADEISDSVAVLNSEKRKILHIAAIFANNFVNHLYAISAEILKSKGISFEVLKPLILETALKVHELDPEKAQTGPAVRFDENIISSHINELKNFCNYQELYNSISKSIFEHHQQLK